VIALTHSTIVAVGFSFRVMWENVVKKVAKLFEKELKFQVIFFKKLDFHMKLEFVKFEFQKSDILLNISQTVVKHY